jgi:hypothetical protein
MNPEWVNTLDTEQILNYYIPTVVVGSTIQLTKLSVSFFIYIKVFLCIVERVSI